MMVNPETIPRYVRPSQAELEEMFREPTPVEIMDRCTHSAACIRVLERWTHEVDTSKSWWMERCAAKLGCEDCDEWAD